MPPADLNTPLQFYGVKIIASPEQVLITWLILIYTPNQMLVSIIIVVKSFLVCLKNDLTYLPNYGMLVCR